MKVEWEYRVEPMSLMPVEANKMLNRLGADGWELVTVFVHQPNSRTAVLKRLKSN